MGRPAFKVTAAKRREVESMKADGFSDDRIAVQLGCSRPTLMKHFAAELEFGADRVRREQLANLRRMSRKNVAAAKALLARADIVATTPPPPPPGDQEKPEKLGKKAEAELAADTAHVGTEWGHLLKH